MSTEIAMTLFQPTSMEQAMKFAQTLANSALLPDALRGKPADVLITIITGQELGLTAMQAIRGMHVIKGKAVMSADLQVALVKRHADCVFFRLVESTDESATYETERKGEGPTKLSFTMAQARQAQLASGDNWKKYPAAMLRARCSSALARAVFPDLMLGVYDPDEAEEFTPPERPIGGGSTSPIPITSKVEEVRAKLAEKIGKPIPAEPAAADAKKARIRAIFNAARANGVGEAELGIWARDVLGLDATKPSTDWTEDDMLALERDAHRDGPPDDVVLPGAEVRT